MPEKKPIDVVIRSFLLFNGSVYRLPASMTSCSCLSTSSTSSSELLTEH